MRLVEEAMEGSAGNVRREERSQRNEAASASTAVLEPSRQDIAGDLMAIPVAQVILKQATVK